MREIRFIVINAKQHAMLKELLLGAGMDEDKEIWDSIKSRPHTAALSELLGYRLQESEMICCLDNKQLARIRMLIERANDTFEMRASDLKDGLAVLHYV